MSEPTTAALEIPSDRRSEEVVVGCAVASAHGAALASEHLTEADLYWPFHGRLFVAAIDITDLDSEVDRISVCAMRADVAESVVAAMVRSRPVMFDTAGSYARRVVEAARRRRVMSVCEQAYRSIAGGAPVEEALELLRAAS